jgi:predicted phosphohydrolase
MKIQFVSDLHIDQWGYGKLCPLPFGPEHIIGDVLVVAGDVDERIPSLVSYLKTLTEAGRPVLFLLGNHEYFSETWTTYRDKLRETLPAGVTFLDCTETVLQNVRFLGCTLWTNFGGSMRKLRDCESGMPDYENIVKDDSWAMITGEDVLARHVEEREWLESRLAESFSGPTVVVTHHAPSERSNRPIFAGSRISAAFYSNLGTLIEKTQPNLWVHGHMHNSSDYRIGKTRVVCNPCGYWEGENEGWNPTAMVEVR